MEDNIRIQDYFKIDDSHSKIRGFVFAKDENGKIIFHKENMITAAGRKLILKKIFNDSDFDFNNITAKVGNGYGVTTPATSTLENAKSVTSVTFGKTAGSDLNYHEDGLYIKLIITLDYIGNSEEDDFNDLKQIRELGLFYGDTLFSRVAFQDYNKTTSNKLTFEYYIYL